MILKTMRKRTYEPENSTDKIETYEVTYIDNIKSLNRVFSCQKLESYLDIQYQDGSKNALIISEKDVDVEKMLYEYIFILNDKGETIDRII